VREFIRNYSVCQRNKIEHLHPAGLLQPLDVPHTNWADIAMDFLEGFPIAAGKPVVIEVMSQNWMMHCWASMGSLYRSTWLERRREPSSKIRQVEITYHPNLPYLEISYRIWR
jgi:hypothetical protein